MAVMAAQPNPEVMKQAIVGILGNRELSPADLIQALVHRLNLSEAAVRVAIWYFISQNELEFSPEQKLRVAQAA